LSRHENPRIFCPVLFIAKRYHTLKIKKIIIYTLIFTLAIIVGYFIVLINYGTIDIKETFETKYHKIENTSDKIIETKYFKIRTPKTWTHISNGYSNEGGSVGRLMTGNGHIHYEYGHFAPVYNDYDGVTTKKTVNRFQINITKDKINQTGICIPTQNEMTSHFSFYMDKTVTNNLEILLNGIKKIEFKKDPWRQLSEDN